MAVCFCVIRKQTTIYKQEVIEWMKQQKASLNG